MTAHFRARFRADLPRGRHGLRTSKCRSKCLATCAPGGLAWSRAGGGRRDAHIRHTSALPCPGMHVAVRLSGEGPARGKNCHGGEKRYAFRRPLVRSPSTRAGAPG